MAIGVPKEAVYDEDVPEYNPSLVRPGYKAPANLPQGGTQGEEQVFYSIKGPTIIKVQNMAVFQLFCKNEDQKLVDIDSKILEAEMIEERNGDTYKGLISKESHGIFKVQFRGRNVGKYHFNIYVKGRMEKRPIFTGEGVPLDVIPHDPIVTQNMYFTASGFGLHGGSVGKSYTFQIEVKDDNNNPIDCNLQKLQVEVSQGLKKLQGDCRSMGTGKYRAQFVPFGPGDMIISVIYGGNPVIQTTVTYNIGIDSTKTIIVEPLRNVLVGQQNTFVIQARGQTGQDMNTGGERFDVACSGPAGGVQGLVIRDELNGKYTVRFTLVKSGTYKIFVSLKGVDVVGSPMEIEAR